jgi:hypothetical protein
MNCPFQTGRLKDPYLYSEAGSGFSIKYATTPGRLISLLTFCLICGATEGPPCFDGPLHKQGCMHAGGAATRCPKSHIAAVNPHLTATAFQCLVLAGQVDLLG